MRVNMANQVIYKVTLHDGREVDSSSEDFRHECEAKYVLNLGTKEKRIQFLTKIEERRGKPSRTRLEQTVLSIWRTKRDAK